MKILHTVEFYHPSIGGMQEVVRQLSERLVRRGHQVTVATTKMPARTEQIVNGVSIEEFPVSGNLVRGLSGAVQSYRNFLLNSDFDIITNFAAQQWATDAMITILDRVKAKKVFVPTGFSGLYDKKYQDYFRQMAGWMKQYDMNVFLSETYRDAGFAKAHGIEKRILIPNGASEEEFLDVSRLDIRSLLGIPQDHFLILHVGSHTGLKGHAESIRIFGSARIRNATFLMIANEYSRRCTRLCRVRKSIFNNVFGRNADGKRIIITSLPREAAIAAYHAADLFLFPSNVECSPLVLFECMASKTPFLTTDVGNSAEIIEWSKAGMVLPTLQRNGYSRALVDDSARLLEKVYGDPETRKNMQDNGFKAWQERFTWEKISSGYEQLYESL